MRSASGVALIVMTLTSSLALADEWTIRQTILRTQYNAVDDSLCFVGPSGWGASSCPNAICVQITSSVAGRDKLLALGMAAHWGEKNVQFRGTCDSSGGNYFYASYVIVD